MIFANFDTERRTEDPCKKNLHFECRLINFDTLSGLFWLAKVLRCCATYLHLSLCHFLQLNASERDEVLQTNIQ